MKLTGSAVVTLDYDKSGVLIGVEVEIVRDLDWRLGDGVVTTRTFDPAGGHVTSIQSAALIRRLIQNRLHL